MNFQQQACLDFIQNESKPFKLIILGRAGTGKSYIIDSLTDTVKCAFTGQAAHLIDGQTIHSLFKIPLKKFKKLLPDALAILRNRFENKKILVIDEFSMLNAIVFKQIDLRLKQIKQNEEDFGGLSVILVGDLFQLAPVNGQPIFIKSDDDKFAQLGFNLYKTFVTVFHFTIQQRLDKNQEKFQKILESIRYGNCSVEEYNFLNTLPESLDDAIRLFSTNKKVEEYNLSKLHGKLYTIRAKNSDEIQYVDRFLNLENNLTLCVGALVLLTKNLSVVNGLYNGARGFVKELQFIDTKLNAIIVDFNGKIVSIQKFSAYEDEELRTGNVRTQYPLRLAYASTVHKCQGATLDRVVVDLGYSEMCPGLTYVALSRVSRIQDLALIKFPYSRLIFPKKYLTSVINEENRLLQMVI